MEATSQHLLGRQTTPVQFGRINYRYCCDLVPQGLSEPKYPYHKPTRYSSVIIPFFSLLPESNVVFQSRVHFQSYCFHKTSFFGKEIWLKIIQIVFLTNIIIKPHSLYNCSKFFIFHYLYNFEAVYLYVCPLRLLSVPVSSGWLWDNPVS